MRNRLYYIYLILYGTLFTHKASVCALKELRSCCVFVQTDTFSVINNLTNSDLVLCLTDWSPSRLAYCAG